MLVSIFLLVFMMFLGYRDVIWRMELCGIVLDGL